MSRGLSHSVVMLLATLMSLILLVSCVPVVETEPDGEVTNTFIMTEPLVFKDCGDERLQLRQFKRTVHDALVNGISKRRFEFSERLLACYSDFCIGSATSALSARSRFVTAETLDGLVIAYARCPNPPAEAKFCNVTIQFGNGSVANGEMSYAGDYGLAETMYCFYRNGKR